jgi:hypothetical protein
MSADSDAGLQGPLDHPDLEDFRPILMSILIPAFTGGIDALAQIGLKMDAIRHSSSARNRFIRGCHYGYDKAQTRIGRAAIELEKRIRETDLTRVLRRTRDPALKRTLWMLQVCRSRQLVLRRVLDTILYSMVAPDHWVLKRFIHEEGIRPIDPSVVARTLETAASLNRGDRHKFHLVTDLTTGVHVGDLIVVNFPFRGSKLWRIVELKEGRMNELLAGVLGGSSEQPVDVILEQVRETLGAHATEQARRIVRQQRRLDEVHKIITTDRGLDWNLATEVRMMPDRVELTSYVEAVSRVVERAHTSGVGTASVDRCLYLVGFGAQVRRVPGDVQHALLHVKEPGLACAMQAGEEARIGVELAAMKSILPVDLVYQNLRSQWGVPLFALFPVDRIADMATGRIKLYAFFDLDAFFQLALTRGIKLRWMSEREVKKRSPMGKFAQRFPGKPDTWGIAVESDAGGKYDAFLTTGFFARIFNEHASPRDLLDMIVRMPTQLAKSARQHDRPAQEAQDTP